MPAPGTPVPAQGPSPADARPRHLLGGSVGLAFSLPDDASDAWGSGYHVTGDYAYDLSPWFQPRAYVGFVNTTAVEPQTEEELRCPANAGRRCDVSATVMMAGGKGRALVAIPYVAPFVEVGLGLSLGRVVTKTEATNEDGVIFAVDFPIAIGIALGADQNFEISWRAAHVSNSHQIGSLTIGYVAVLH